MIGPPGGARGEGKPRVCVSSLGTWDVGHLAKERTCSFSSSVLCGWFQGKVSPLSLCLCVCRKHGLWLPCCVWPNSPAGSALDLILGFTCSPWLGLGEKSIMAAWAANDMFKPHSSLMLWALKHPYSTDGETEARGQFTWDQLCNLQVGEPGIWLRPL